MANTYEDKAYCAFGHWFWKELIVYNKKGIPRCPQHNIQVRVKRHRHGEEKKKE